MDIDLWADFNALRPDGVLTTLAEYSRAGYTPAAGDKIVVGDDEGTFAQASVWKVGDDGLVVLHVDFETVAYHDAAQATVARA